MAVEHINENQFKSVVLESEKPVLVDFFAKWCGPCRQMSPILEQVSEERSDVKIVKVDVDENQNLAAEYGVMSIPTLIYFKGGKAVSQAVGARSKASLEMMLV
ncbi:MAG TPA: thioredoxin [Candidatus Ornithospirochaeta stercorigallinarum]|nr:thioredoxin [Candidatus Ornithospirochaeta stercorigallinarum]